MKRILVSGAGGFIGCNLVSYLKDLGHYVIAVDKEFPASREKQYGQADEIKYADLRNMDDVVEVFGDYRAVDWVFHLAADMGGVGYFHAHDYVPFLHNMTMDMNMLNVSKIFDVQRFFYASSACIYPTHLQMTEGQPPKLSEDMIYPANSDQMYGWEKLMMTKLCERAPFPSRVGIFHTIYGPYQEIAGERMKAPTALATKALAAKETGKLEIWGNGKQIRSFLYIDDAIERIYTVMNSNDYEGPVNIGSEEAVTMQQVAEICCEVLGITPEFTYTDAKPSGVLSRNCDNTKFNRIYGYRDTVSVKEGFTKLIKWLQTL